MSDKQTLTTESAEIKKLKLSAQRLFDSRIRMIGDNDKPKYLVEVFWLDELAKILDLEGCMS